MRKIVCDVCKRSSDELKGYERRIHRLKQSFADGSIPTRKKIDICTDCLEAIGKAVRKESGIDD